MNKDEINYILHYFGNLMTDDEKLALRYHQYTSKTSENSNMRKKMVEKGWISQQPEIQEMLKDGYEEFESNVAKRIVTECPDKVFFNRCTKCNHLARTPYARQCKNCGHRWHEIVQAKFKLTAAFQLTGRQFFLLGQITRGEAKIGHFIDLTLLGLNQHPKIEVIESALKIDKEGAWGEDIGLGISELTEEEKEYIKTIGSFETSLDIIDTR